MTALDVLIVVLSLAGLVLFAGLLSRGGYSKAREFRAARLARAPDPYLEEADEPEKPDKPGKAEESDGAEESESGDTDEPSEPDTERS